MPVQTFLEFILYIAPGFLALEVYHAVYAVRERGDFVQITSSVIYGVIIYAVVKWFDQHYFAFALHSNRATFPNLRFTLALFGAAIIAGGLGVLFHWLRFKASGLDERLTLIAPDAQSVWAKVNNHPSNRNYAVVFLDDGAIYNGYISWYTFDPNKEDQDFLLGDAVRVDENLTEKYIIDGIGVYLSTKNVKRIEFIRGIEDPSDAVSEPSILEAQVQKAESSTKIQTQLNKIVEL